MPYNSLLDVSEDTSPAIAALDAVLEQAGNSITDIRQALTQATDDLIASFKAGRPVSELVMLRAAIVDRVLVRLWREHVK